ncbi:MAG TPA: aminotransferase class I/II-fold pyridoxal phosphate-dependent enzyme [Candidatus Lachnoclostridium pullistercoris]|uniref:Aminotransferase n=1 Tax=Candidatus Lachnoclostridium pullistercoris TaxID=2838632 RepID=A0A9D2T592_9FIRM|nr:aminotransferase class I/II-fold pyridoxal phosphate-dependent enzyme [Candidatus Lachnoclostridium pullistercoris]
MRFAKRMDSFGEGVFSALAEIRRKKEANGERVIDFSIGAPNIPPAPHIRQALCEAAADEKNYVYAISDRPELLAAAAGWYDRRYGVKLDPQTEICSVMGSQEGLAHIALSVIDEGDLVLVPSPCYPVFGDGPRIAGAQIWHMEQKKENGYVIRLDEIPEEIAKKARLMVVSYPNNPTTALAPDSFYEELVAFAEKYDIIVIHDNAYSELVFDGASCGSFLKFPGAKEVGVEFNSLSKTYGMAGARVGFCLGNEQVIARLRLLKSNMDYGMFLPVQMAAEAALNGDQSCVETTRKAYERRRDVLCGSFGEAGWQMEKPKATMFVWAPVPEGYADSRQFAMELVERAGVLVTPGSAFGESGEGFVRIALVQDEETILEAAEALKRSGMFSGN